MILDFLTAEGAEGAEEERRRLDLNVLLFGIVGFGQVTEFLHELAIDPIFPVPQ